MRQKQKTSMLLEASDASALRNDASWGPGCLRRLFFFALRKFSRVVHAVTVTTAVAAMLAACGGGSGGNGFVAPLPVPQASSPTEQTPPETPPPVPPKSLTKSGKWIVDEYGRVVITHGFNIAQKTTPFYPNFLTEDDAKFLRSQGFNVARISFHWVAAEPQPGVYDEAYIRNLLGVNAMLAKYGIHTLIDFHHNGYSGARGGAPSWATFGSFQSAFQAFWENKPAADGVGIQDRFVKLWAHIAQVVKTDPAAGNIIGFDPLNEPSPGLDTGCAAFGEACPAWEAGQLGAFYQKVIAAIRSTGDQHVIWPEGPPGGRVAPELPKFADTMTGWNFHYYCKFSENQSGRLLTDEEQAQCQQEEAQDLPLYWAKAEGRSEPIFVSEFGCSEDPRTHARMVDQMGKAFAHWASWEWHLDGNATGPCPGLLINNKGRGTLENVKTAKLAALTVPYPQAIAGVPLTYNFDRATRNMTFTYAPKGAVGLRTEIFIPQLHYPQGYNASVSGGTVISDPIAAKLMIVSDGSGSDVSVTVTPDNDSATAVP